MRIIEFRNRLVNIESTQSHEYILPVKGGLCKPAGIDVSTLMNLMLPAVILGIMAKVMFSMLSKKKQVKTDSTESTTPQTEETTS